MESKRHIKVWVDEQGNVEAETFHYEGPQCIDELTKLMRDLAELTSDIKKDESFKSRIIIQEREKVKR